MVRLPRSYSPGQDTVQTVQTRGEPSMAGLPLALPLPLLASHGKIARAIFPKFWPGRDGVGRGMPQITRPKGGPKLDIPKTARASWPKF